MPLFYSPHAGYRLLIKPQYDKRHPTTGDIIDTEQALWVDFGKYGEVQTFMNPETGESHTGAQVIGHYYDTDAEAIDRGWDQDTHDHVVRRLRDAMRREPYRVQEIARELPKAGVPWPTFDQADAKQIVELAPALGLVAATLAYERENRNRPTVIDALEALLAGPDTPPGEDEPEVPDVAVKAAEALLTGQPGSRTITV
jgi:hypothetical protein